MSWIYNSFLPPTLYTMTTIITLPSLLDLLPILGANCPILQNLLGQDRRSRRSKKKKIAICFSSLFPRQCIGNSQRSTTNITEFNKISGNWFQGLYTYCKDNNINLLRIPYWEYDNIEYILKEIPYETKDLDRIRHKSMRKLLEE